MKIFVDFDDVIFNSKLFKADLMKVFTGFGISEELFNWSYFNYLPNRKSSTIKTYILEKQIESIKSKISINGNQLRRAVKIFLKNTEKYIFPDFKIILNNFSKKQLFLISHGNQSFQKIKINNSGIRRFFGAVRISKGLKYQEIKKLIKKDKYFQKKGPFLFLDDRVRYLEEVKKYLPEIITILFQRPEGRYFDKKNNYCDFKVKNFSDVLSIINRFK